MASNPAGKGRVVIGTSIPKELADELKRRAESLGLTPSAYLRQILLKWAGEGFPPVTEADAALIERRSGDKPPPPPQKVYRTGRLEDLDEKRQAK